MIQYLEATLDATTTFDSSVRALRKLEASLEAVSVLAPTRFIKLAVVEHCISPDFAELVVDGKELGRC
jgi:hypothetical protein